MIDIEVGHRIVEFAVYGEEVKGIKRRNYQTIIVLSIGNGSYLFRNWFLHDLIHVVKVDSHYFVFFSNIEIVFNLRSSL